MSSQTLENPLVFVFRWLNGNCWHHPNKLIWNYFLRIWWDKDAQVFAIYIWNFVRNFVIILSIKLIWIFLVIFVKDKTYSIYCSKLHLIDFMNFVFFNKKIVTEAKKFTDFSNIHLSLTIKIYQISIIKHLN